MTYNDNIKKIELENECLGAAKAASDIFVTESSDTKSSGFKRKKNWKINGKEIETEEVSSKKKQKQNSKRGKCFFKKKKQEKMKC